MKHRNQLSLAWIKTTTKYKIIIKTKHLTNTIKQERTRVNMTQREGGSEGGRRKLSLKLLG